MTRFRLLLIIIFCAAVLLAPLAMAQPNAAQREAAYQSAIDRLPATQNSDGGFGAVEQLVVDGNTTNVTVGDHASFLQTVLTVHILIAEKTGRADTWTNWEQETTSLARSNTSSARDWLQQYEKDKQDTLLPGDRGLLALAYHDLGDNENAHKTLSALLDQEADVGLPMGAIDLAKILYTHQQAGFDLNETQAATLDHLDRRLAAMGLGAPEALAWALLAQPHDGDRRAALAQHLEGDLSLAFRALATWALAKSGGADLTTEAAIEELYLLRAPAQGLPHTFLLLAERTANPHFSIHVDLVEATTGLPTGAGSTPGDPVAQEPSTDETPGPAAPDGSTGTDAHRTPFPIPTWAVMGTILFALAVLLVTGLAYGLKREDLEGPRKEIFDYIDSHPGEHFSKIRRDLGLAPGTFQHHLSVLESGGWITSYKDARYKRYFVNGNRYKQMIAGFQYKQRFAALANGTTRDLVQFVRDHPGVTQKEVALRLNLHASTVNWHANRLKQAGILTPQRVGREVRYHVDDDVVRKMLQQANN